MNADLKKIKKLYGEKMMHLCRSAFPTILEEPGKLVELMTDNFEPSRFLYEDIIKSRKEDSFKDYIFTVNDKKEELEEVEKSVSELLSEAGYDFFECTTEEDIQSFRHYYEKKEELCTFWTNRLNTCYVFFAVKKNVDEIKRSDYDKPERQDEYGTSVISIQFTKNSSNTLSIKNRYNHTVQNPDATFSNNLENIIPGLTKAFEREYDLHITQNSGRSFELPGYIKASDDKFYKYNYEIDNIYYCPNNVIIESFEAKKIEKEKYIVMDYFTLDLVNKKMIINEKSPIAKEDSFIDEFNDIDKINVINTDNGNKEIRITTKTNHEIIIGLDKYNRIISYHNPRITEVKDNFLSKSNALEVLSLPNVTKVGNNCVPKSNVRKLDMPKVKEIGNDFLNYSCIKDITFDCLEKVGNNFMNSNRILESIKVPNLKEIGDGFLSFNIHLTEIDLPKVESIGECFMDSIRYMEKISAPLLRKVGGYFLNENLGLTEISFPNLESVGTDFISRNRKISQINLPKLKKVGDSFLSGNAELKHVSLPSVEEVGDMFMLINKNMESIDMPNLRKSGTSFLHNNEKIRKISFPKLEKVSSAFMVRNECLEEAYLPNLLSLGTNFLANNKALRELDLPSVQVIGSAFLHGNRILERLSMPRLQTIKDGFLENNTNLTYLNIDSVQMIYGEFLPLNETLEEIHASNLRPFFKKQLSTRFKIIPQEEKIDKKIEKEKAEEKKEVKEESDSLTTIPIVKVEKSKKTISSMINSLIKKGINIFNPNKSQDKEKKSELGGIKK